MSLAVTKSMRIDADFGAIESNQPSGSNVSRCLTFRRATPVQVQETCERRQSDLRTAAARTSAGSSLGTLPIGLAFCDPQQKQLLAAPAPTPGLQRLGA